MFYDIKGLGNDPTQAEDQARLGTTLGNWNSPPSVNLAAMLGVNAQRNNEAGRDSTARAYSDNLASSFAGDAQQNFSMDVDSLLKNPNWNQLYATDPQRANLVYKNRAGVSFDDALKARQDQKKFLQTTLQSKLAQNQIRQDEAGSWQESQDVPDESGMPGATKKSWGPASLQTLDLIHKAGGVQSTGLDNFSTMDDKSKVALMVKYGYPKPLIKQFVDSRTDRTVAKPTISSVAPTPTNQVEGAYPFAKRKIGQGIDYLSQPSGNDDPNESMGSNLLLMNILHNAKAGILGGRMNSLTNPEITNDTLSKLKMLQNF